MKHKAQSIAESIKVALEGVHRIEIPLGPLRGVGLRAKAVLEEGEADEFSEPVLTELARLTNTEVVRISKDRVSSRNPYSHSTADKT